MAQEVKLSIKIETTEIMKIDFNENVVTVLPVSSNECDLHNYSSTALSFLKYAKRDIDIELLSEPKTLVEQRSGEWFGPMILITSSLLSGNSALVSVLCGVVSNYLTDFFKGKSEEPVVKLKVLYKETKSSKTTEISYEGDIQGIESLEQSILEVVKKGQ